MSFPRAAKVAKVLLRALPVPAGVLLAAAIVVSSSQAAFTAQTGDAGSSWKASTLSISNSTDGSVNGNMLFHGRNISPGYEESRCVTIHSTSDVETYAKMYGVDVTENPISETMRIRIDKGETDDDRFHDTSCETFRNGNELYEGSLSDFGRHSTDYSHGLSDDPHGDALRSGGNATYRITLHLPESADNSVAGSKAGATFKWEAQR